MYEPQQPKSTQTHLHMNKILSPHLLRHPPQSHTHPHPPTRIITTKKSPTHMSTELVSLYTLDIGL